jgi:hypothetical protein
MADAYITAYSRYIEASQRFDYFVTGAAGVVLSYAVQSYSPVTGDVVPWLPPIAWLCLLGSAGSGLAHLHITVSRLRINAGKISIQEDVHDLREANWKHLGVFMHAPNIAIAPADIPAAVALHDEELAKIAAILGQMRKREGIAGTARNVLLFCGLAALTIWKILSL